MTVRSAGPNQRLTHADSRSVLFIKFCSTPCVVPSGCEVLTLDNGCEMLTLDNGCEVLTIDNGLPQPAPGQLHLRPASRRRFEAGGAV